MHARGQRPLRTRAISSPTLRLRLGAKRAEAEATGGLRMRFAMWRGGVSGAGGPGAAGNRAERAGGRAVVAGQIAGEEDVTRVEAARGLLAAGAADTLVVKPMTCGGSRPALEIATLADDAGVAVVVTTTIDSGVGTATALQLAATLPANGPACGLATSSLLADDLVSAPLSARNGWLDVASGPGPSVELEEAKLARYGVDHG